MVILSGGMQKSGSAWFYHMTNRLLALHGCPQTQQLREQFGLGDIVLYENCLLRAPNDKNLGRLLKGPLAKQTFAVKLHAPPPPGKSDRWLKKGKVKATYIYRDPRAAALSAYDHGVKLRAAGRLNHPFAELHTHRDALNLAAQWLANSVPRWLNYAPETFRYEDLKSDPMPELERLANYLELPTSSEELRSIHDAFKEGKSSSSAMHFNRGIVDRWRKEYSVQDRNYAEQLFGDWLTKLGYAK